MSDEPDDERDGAVAPDPAAEEQEDSAAPREPSFADFGADDAPDRDGEDPPSNGSEAPIAEAPSVDDGRSDGTAAEPDPDAPMGDLASSLEQREESTDPPEDVFSEEEVPEIDADVVWERLEDDDRPAPPSGPEPDVRVVATAEYCEQCPYFDEPPAVRCTHEGTEIRELVDMDHFRVVDCPKVAENERLENL